MVNTFLKKFASQEELVDFMHKEFGTNLILEETSKGWRATFNSVTVEDTEKIAAITNAADSFVTKAMRPKSYEEPKQLMFDFIT